MLSFKRGSLKRSESFKKLMVSPEISSLKFKHNFQNHTTALIAADLLKSFEV